MSNLVEDDRSAPGTVQLIDADGHLNVKHSKGAKDIVLVPTPSDDPEDPLNWTKKRKLLQTSCVVMYTLMMVFPSSAVYSVVTPISKSTGISVTTINRGTGFMFLLYGWSTIFWQALALQYGKRPVYLVSLAVSVVIMGIAPMCTTDGPYLAARILQGFFGGPVESLCEISMTDIWFAHERPFYLAVYGLTLAASGKLAPAFAAFINSGQNWKWTLWWCAIGIGIAFVYCFFLMEETNYDRHIIQPVSISQSSLEITNEKEMVSSERSFGPSGSVDEKKTPVENPTVDIAAAEVGQITYPRRTYLQKLSIVDKKRPNRFLDIMLAPFKFFTYPVVVWAGFMYGLQGLVYPGIVNATASVTYTNKYGFSSDAIGFAYFAAVVGMVIGACWVAFLGPWLVMHLARRNNGVSEPEHILWLFGASFVVVPVAMILWGVGGTHGMHWFGMVFAQAILAISSTLCLSTAIQYATSTYRDLGGELVTTIILIRNTLSFAINYAINPWIDAQGTQNCFITVAVIALVLNGTMFPMIKWGKQLRKMSARRYWTAVEQARAKGMGH